MNGVHDMGGMHGFGPIAPDAAEPLFHEPWERDVLALTLAMGARGVWTLDESRFARESIKPADYLSIGYYRIWLRALEYLMEKHQLLDIDELNQFIETGVVGEHRAEFPKPILSADAVAGALKAGSPVDRPSTDSALFRVGQPVRVKNLNPKGHTRLPRYVRGHIGVIHAVHGCHVYPDTNAHQNGEQPTWLYNVRFDATELWGEASTASSVHVDCWQPYLDLVND